MCVFFTISKKANSKFDASQIWATLFISIYIYVSYLQYSRVKTKQERRLIRSLGRYQQQKIHFTKDH